MGHHLAKEGYTEPSIRQPISADAVVAD